MGDSVTFSGGGDLDTWSYSMELDPADELDAANK